MDQPRPAARLIVEELPRAGETARIGGEEAAHARARRLAVGDRVVLVDGSGREAEGAVARVGKAALDVTVEAVRGAPEEGPAVTLCVAGVRPERLDWIAEKATELGVARLVLVAPERAQAFRASAARGLRLTRVVREAAKQCGRARWPEVAGPVALADALALPAAHRFLLDLEGGPFPSVLAADPSVLLVGPEGGWTASERAAARESGWTAVRLPAGKLRTETAAIAGLVLLRAALSRPRTED
jgi:16S rRNA (uracil1498-N3)-methyltransferase